MEMGQILTSEQVAFHRESGYVLATGLFTPGEAAALRAETHALAERLMERKNIDATWSSAREMDEKRGSQVKTKLLHCHDVQFHSAAFARLIVDEQLAGAASQCIGSPNVQLHHTKMRPYSSRCVTPRDPPTIKTHESRGQCMMLRGIDLLLVEGRD
jgi:hypothetical protein